MLTSDAGTPQTTDAELVDRLATGDQSALVELYRRHGRRIHPLIRRIVTDERLAEEVLQDVFLRLWTRPERYRPEAGQLLAWLLTVARNLSLDALRREKRWRAHLDLDDAMQQHLPAPEPSIDLAVTTAIRQAMDSLPADQRQTLELAYVSGLTHAELAAQLDEPLGTVKSRLRLALAKLRKSLGHPVETFVGCAMTPCQRYESDWDLLALGALDEAEGRAMREHLVSGCGTCAPRWRDATGLIATIGASLDAAEPPPHIEMRLRRRLKETGAHTAIPSVIVPAPPRQRAWRWPAVAAAVMALAVGGVGLWQNRGLRNDLREAERRLAAATTAAAPADPSPAAATAAPQVPAMPPATPTPPITGTGPTTGPSAPWVRERAQLEDAVARAETARREAEAEAVRLRTALETERRVVAADAPADTLARIPAQPDTLPVPARSVPVDEVSDLQATIARLTKETQTLQDEVQRQTAARRDDATAVAAAFDERARRVTLRPIDPAAGRASATATLAGDGRLLLVARDLPVLPATKCYQLWVIRRDNPAIVSGGVVTVTAGQAVHSVRLRDDAGAITGFALTDEPAGGSRESRGRKLLFGALN